MWDEAGPQTPKSRSRHKKQNNHNPPPTSTPPGRSFSASFLSQQVDRGLDCPSAAANHSQSANSPCARLHPTALSSAESLSSPTLSVTTLSRCPPIRAKRSLICHSFLLFLRGSPHTQGPTPFRAWGRVAEAYYLSCLREDKLSLSRVGANRTVFQRRRLYISWDLPQRFKQRYAHFNFHLDLQPRL